MSSTAKSKAKGRGRVTVNKLEQSTKELSAQEQKKVKGGVIRSVGNRDGGGTNAAAGGGAGLNYLQSQNNN